MLAGFLDELAATELAPPMQPEERLRHMVTIARSCQARGYKVAYEHARKKAVSASHEVGLLKQIYTRVRLSAAQISFRWARRRAANLLLKARGMVRRALRYVRGKRKKVIYKDI